MVAPIVIRPMAEEDVGGSVGAWLAANADLRQRLGLPATRASGADRDRIGRRIDHLRRTDPDGAWVAARGRRVVGLGQSFVRGDYWVLSLLGVEPSAQGTGAGRSLLERASGHGAGCRGTIQASQDPRAAALYASAGFALHPSVSAHGTLRPGRPAAPGSVRRGGVGDLVAAAAVDRHVRGTERTADLRLLLEHDGATLLLEDDRAYAVTLPDRLVTLAARDPASAVAVLRGALALAPSKGVYEVAWLTARQQWAVPVVLAAGLTFHPRGPVMVRGMEGPPYPYLPSGGLG